MRRRGDAEKAKSHADSRQFKRSDAKSAKRGPGELPRLDSRRRSISLSFVFVLKDIAKEFKTDIPSVTATLFLTLAMPPLGAFLFGMMADRFGRRPTLMIDIMFYSVVEFLSGFAPSLTALVILRAFYGIAMGGEWGVRASLTMDSSLSKGHGALFQFISTSFRPIRCEERFPVSLSIRQFFCLKEWNDPGDARCIVRQQLRFGACRHRGHRGDCRIRLTAFGPEARGVKFGAGAQIS